MPRSGDEEYTLTAAAALVRGQRLTINTSGQWAVAGIEPTVAICIGDAASGAPAAGQLMCPTFEVRVAAAVTAGQLLYPTTSGNYTPTPTGANGPAEMIALQSASGNNSIIECVKYVNTNGLRVVGYATAVPSSGAYLQGDITLNSGPDATEYIGWVCTVAGSPGTQKGFGTIQT